MLNWILLSKQNNCIIVLRNSKIWWLIFENDDNICQFLSFSIEQLGMMYPLICWKVRFEKHTKELKRSNNSTWPLLQVNFINEHPHNLILHNKRKTIHAIWFVPLELQLIENLSRLWMQIMAKPTMKWNLKYNCEKIPCISIYFE